MIESATRESKSLIRCRTSKPSPQDSVVSRPMASENSRTSNQSPIQPISRGLCARLSQWLWPSLWGCETARPPTQTYTDSLGCKACGEWHVACDHAKPQCSHCYQQQILCFYVNTNPPKRHKRLDSVPQLGPPLNSRRAQTSSVR